METKVAQDACNRKILDNKKRQTVVRTEDIDRERLVNAVLSSCVTVDFVEQEFHHEEADDDTDGVPDHLLGLDVVWGVVYLVASFG